VSDTSVRAATDEGLRARKVNVVALDRVDLAVGRGEFVAADGTLRVWQARSYI